MGICLQCTGKLAEAVQVYETVLREHTAKLDVKLRLAAVYEELGQRENALQLVNEGESCASPAGLTAVVGARNETLEGAREGSELPPAWAARHDAAEGEDGQASLSFFNESVANSLDGSSALLAQSTLGAPTARGNRASISFAERQRLEQQREEETRLAWIQLSALEPVVFCEGFWRPDFVFLDAADGNATSDARAKRDRYHATRQWMQVAERLVHSFRSMSLLFPKERFTKYRGVIRPRRNRRSKATDLDSHAEELLSRLRDHLGVSLMDR